MVRILGRKIHLRQASLMKPGTSWIGKSLRIWGVLISKLFYFLLTKPTSAIDLFVFTHLHHEYDSTFLPEPVPYCFSPWLYSFCFFSFCLFLIHLLSLYMALNFCPQYQPTSACILHSDFLWEDQISLNVPAKQNSSISHLIGAWQVSLPWTGHMLLGFQ